MTNQHLDSIAMVTISLIGLGVCLTFKTARRCLKYAKLAVASIAH